MDTVVTRRRVVGAPGADGYPARLLWTGYGVLGALVFAYFISLLARPVGSYSTVVDGWLVDAVEIVVSLLCLSKAFQRRPGRSVALLLGLALLSWSLGDIALTIESLGGATPPTPSAADAFYLAFYPLAYVAVVQFMRGGVRRLTNTNWLDGLVAGLGAAAVCGTFAFRSIEHSAGGGALAVATNLAYPVGDLLLLALVVGATTVLSGRRKAPWLLIATGIALNVVGDTFNLFGSTFGNSRAGYVANGIAWPVAILLISMAVWLKPRPSDPLAEQRPTSFLLPGLAAAAGLVILFVGTLVHPGRVSIALATATLVAGGIRGAMSVRSLRMLTAERHRQSVTDELTGLGNRRFLFNILDTFFADQVDPLMPQRRMAFLFIDLNHFKEVNDSFGHPAGDRLLKQLGPRFAKCLRPSDALVRLGGDEFAVTLMDADAESARAVAERLQASLRESFALDVVNAQVGASIGIALAPDHATDAAGLVWAADVAMYRSKAAQSDYAFYDHKVDNEGNRLRFAGELATAIEEGQFVLHYQPQLDLRTGEIFTVEALVRWMHPDHGMVPPLRFLPAAEEAGLMGSLTSLVLSMALTQCAAWRAGGRPMTVSVNVSATNLLDEGFTELVFDQLERHGLPPEALVLEITETSIITDFARAKLVIRELRDRGLVVSIDDFGAGYTSLAYLSSLAVKELKLDCAFITGLGTGGEDRNLELVRATIELGHALGLRVVAEGIEDNATLELLSQLGCDLAQGYYISTPKAAHELAFRAAAVTSPPR